ncbi:MAG: hypothetical protein IPJ84_19955 [Bdellovibrionales bacterium]|nr:hypothetical protein [Bdellovibrionales bacterium]
MISPLDVSVDRDGNIFFSDWDANRVRKIDTNGIITTVVGTGTAGYSGDGGPATAAEIHGPRSVIANPDGSLFVSEEFNHVIRRIDPSGMIKTFAGTGTEGYSGDGGPAIDADFSFPNYTATDADGNLYVGQSGFCAIRKITPSGIVTTIAGYGECGFSLDGEPATMSKVGNVAAIAIGKNGVIYFADRSNHRIRSIDAFGTLTTVIGTGQTAFNGLSRTGATTNLAFPTDVEVRPDGSLVFIEFNRNVMREFVPAPQPTAAQPGTTEIASPDGSEIFVFNENGIHLRTLFGETRAAKFNFEYTTDNRLTAMVDSGGNRTEVLRSSSGAPTAIRSPYGQLYSLQVDELDGQENLARLTYPTGESYQLRYNAFGLLTSFTKPKGGEYTFQYSDDGRLAGETDPAGGSQVIGLSFRRTREGNEVWIDHEMDRLGNSILTTRSGDETYRSAVFDSGLRATNDPTLTQTNTLSTVDTRLMGLAQYEAYSDLFFAGNPSKIVQTTNRTYTSSPGAFVRTDRTTTQQGWFETVFNSSTGTYTSTTSEGRLSTAVIDAQTRPLRIQIGNLEPTLMSYDTRGRVSQITQGNRTTDFAYDTNGFLLETRNALGQVNRTQYDGSQKLISTTNPKCEQRRRSHTTLIEIFIARFARKRSSRTRFNRDGSFSGLSYTIRPRSWI